jgi:hypothetical protein
MVAGVATAATPGTVPNNTLAVMGISMQPMTDVQGTEVRGMGYCPPPTSACVSAGFTFGTSTQKCGTCTTCVTATTSANATGQCSSFAATAAAYPVSAVICLGGGTVICLHNSVVVGAVAIGH